MKHNSAVKQMMREFNTQMALKETEIDSTVKETIGKTGKSCEGQSKHGFGVICRSRVVQLHEKTVFFLITGRVCRDYQQLSGEMTRFLCVQWLDRVTFWMGFDTVVWNMTLCFRR